MSSRSDRQRQERNLAAFRDAVNTGSLSVVRDPVEGGAISGTRRKRPIPSIGQRLGKITVTGYIRGVRGGVSAVLFKCDCGRPEFMRDIGNIKPASIGRCPACANAAGRRKQYWAYYEAMPFDDHRRRLLNRLSSAITRCHNKADPKYNHYGDRGIYVYDAWRNDRATFLRYVQTLPGWDIPELEMDRIDNYGPYAPGNIHFVPKSKNMSNRRSVVQQSKEIADLRHRLRRAEEQIYSCDCCRAAYRP